MKPYPPNLNTNQQVSRHVVEETKKEESDQTSNLLGIDWDSDKNHQTRFVKWVMDQKMARREEERKLQEQWSMLMQEKNSVEEHKRKIEDREAKISEIRLSNLKKWVPSFHKFRPLFIV